MAEGYCINHPSTPCTTRCNTCHKPVCAQCVIENRFCSDVCQKKYEHFNKNYKSEKKSGLFAAIKGLIVWAIFLPVVALIAVYAGAKILHIGFCENLLKSVGL